jgi:hypothetical protein
MDRSRLVWVTYDEDALTGPQRLGASALNRLAVRLRHALNVSSDRVAHSRYLSRARRSTSLIFSPRCSALVWAAVHRSSETRKTLLWSNTSPRWTVSLRQVPGGFTGCAASAQKHLSETHARVGVARLAPLAVVLYFGKGAF